MTTVGPLDVINIEQSTGAPRSYDALRDRALRIELTGHRRSPSPGLSDLIRMKRAAGRDHDLADIEALTRRPDNRPEGRR